MKMDIDCTLRSGEAEIAVSPLEQLSKQEFEEYVDIMRREGFEYDPYEKSNFFRTSNPKTLKAMLEFLNKEFEVSGTLRGNQKYTWGERDKFVEDFIASIRGQ